MRFLALLVFYFPLFMLQAGEESSITIALIGKTKNDSFYQQSYQGCVAAAKLHAKLNCIYDGPLDYQDPRSQAFVVNELIEQGIDGLLISVTDSALLTRSVLKKAALKNIPVLTFDSDLLPEHQAFRLAYVGTNNQDFGLALGNYAKKLLEQASLTQAKICIHSGHQSTPNLNARIDGVRLALSDGKSTARLAHASPWSELDRCPLYSLGKRDLAIGQLEYILQKNYLIINIAVAGFAQFSPDYISRITPYKEKILSKEAIIISADTEQIQLNALKQGLSTINIGQRPYEMGRVAAELLYQYLNGKKKPEQERYFLDFHYCSIENYDSCTKK